MNKQQGELFATAIDFLSEAVSHLTDHDKFMAAISKCDKVFEEIKRLKDEEHTTLRNNNS